MRMKKRGCGPQTAALLSLWAVKAVAGVVVWNGGGADGKWTTPGNWTGGALPLATDTVEFGSGFDSGNIILDASQTVAGMIINYNKSSGGLYLGGVPANALTLNGNIKRTGGVSHLVFTCPVILNDTLTITNEASGNTRFARPVTSGHDIIFQGNIGSALEFSDNNRATFSGDIVLQRRRLRHRRHPHVRLHDAEIPRRVANRQQQHRDQGYALYRVGVQHDRRVL